MRGLVGAVGRWWRGHRLRRTKDALGLIKARYQTFRTLLDSNSLAVELITDLGMRLGEGEMGGAFRDKAEALGRVVGDMTAKFASLEGRKSDLVTTMHQRLSALLAEELARLPAAGLPPAVLPLAEVPVHGARLCGAKATNLARFHGHDCFKIPDGFVVTAPGCRLFFDHNDLALRSARILGAGQEEDPEKLAAAAGRLQSLVREAAMPPKISAELARMATPFFRQGKGLAVRSSAISEDGRTHSFAGQFATVLNVIDAAHLTDAFREVLASAFSPRAITYRRHAGLSPLAFDMAVLCLEMVPARAAGIIITREPSGGQGLLISAVLGLGEAAVGGSAAADLYHVNRQGMIITDRTVIASKGHRLVPRIGGGIGLEPVPEAEQRTPALADDEIRELASRALDIETMADGVPQDIEWAVSMDHELVILQARPLAGGQGRRHSEAVATTPALLSGGQTASRGRACGRVRIVKRQCDLTIPAVEEPLVLVLSQSLPDAARLVDRLAAIVVELGNPADHLANVARENSVPMICAANGATTTLTEGEWVQVDADEGLVRPIEPQVAASGRWQKTLPKTPPRPLDPRVERCRALLTRLNLTDAYGPSFNVLECRSLHDLVRFIHEKAVLAMFEGSDDLLEETDWLVHHLVVDGIPFLLSIIDLGGALRPDLPRRIRPDDIVAPPFRALWQGIATPGLHWGPPPAGSDVSKVFSRWLTDHQSDRVIGMPNYVIAGRDYLNLNARMDFHFIMVDAVASIDPRANHIRFRFKGGGTGAEQRARRVRCIAEILEANGFFTNVRDDLVGADLHGAPATVIEERLVVIGRLLGFTRLLDAGMRDDAMAHRAAQAFIDGDYGMNLIRKQL